MKKFLVYEESSGQSSPKKSIRLVSCGCGMILFYYPMSMFMLWTGNVEGYNRKMKVVLSVAC